MAKAENALDSIGISIRGETADSLRGIEEIIDDVADAWDTLSDSQKQAVSEAMAGTQRSSMFSALIENYEKVKELRDAGLGAEGELAKANQVRVESLAGIQGQLEVTKEALYATIISDQEMMKILKGTDYLLQGLTVVVKFIKSAWIPAATALVTSIYAADTAMRANKWGVQYLVLDKFVPVLKSTITQFVTFNSKLVLSKQGLVDFTKGIKLTGLGMSVLIGVAIQAGVEMYKSFKRMTPGIEELRSQIQSLTSATQEFSQTNSNLEQIKADTSSMREMVAIIEDENQSIEVQQEKAKEVNELLAQHASSYTSIEPILKNENLEYESRIKLLERAAELEKQEAQTKAVEELYGRDWKAWGTTTSDKMLNSTKDQVKALLDNYSALIEMETIAKEHGESTSQQTLEYIESLSLGVDKQKNAVEGIAIELANYYMNIKQLYDDGALDESQYQHFLQYYKDGVEELKKITEETDLDLELQLDIEEFMAKTVEANKATQSVKTKLGELSTVMNESGSAEATAKSISKLVAELENLEDGSGEARDVLKQLHSTFEDMPDDVDTLSEAIDYLNGKLKEASEASDMKDLNESYLEALESLEEAQDLLDSFADGLDVSELRNLFDSDLMADYNGSLNDTASMLDHIKGKMQELQDKSYETGINMILNNNDAWNQMTADMAESLGIQSSEFQNYLNDKGLMREVDIQNANSAADAQTQAEMSIVRQGAQAYSDLVNSKASNRQTDMGNVAAFLNTQKAKEATTVEELKQMWAAYYNARKQMINSEISKARKSINAMAGPYDDQGNIDPAVMSQFNTLRKQLNALETANNDMVNYFANVSTGLSSVSNSLSQATSNIQKSIGKATSGSGSKSSGSKGNSGSKGSSSSTKKEVEDLDLKIDKFKEYEEAVNRASEALQRNQEAQRMVTSKAELKKLLTDEINLMEKKKTALANLQKELQKEQQSLKQRLEKSGFLFNGNELVGDKVTGGSVTDRLLNAQKWANSTSGTEKEWRINDTLYVQQLVEAYYDLMNQIGDVNSQYNDMAYEIRQAKKEHEELLKQVESLADRYLKFTMKENALSNELSLNRRKQEYAVGTELLKLRERELQILQEQKKVNADKVTELQKEKEELKQVLIKGGFQFDKDGLISNYERLWESATAKYNTLAGTAAEDYKEYLDELADSIDRYLEIVNSELPEAEEYYYDIADALKEIEEQQKEWAKQLEDVAKLLDRLYDVTKKLSKAENELALIESKLATAQGDDKIALLKRQEEIYRAQTKLIEEQYKIQKDQMKEMQMELSNLGVAFDEDGYVSNYEDLVKKMQKQIEAMPGGEARDKAIKELEELLAKIEEYDDLVRNDLPSTEQSWWNLNASIKDAQKQQLQIVEDVQTSIANAIKNKWQENTQALQDEIDKQKDILNKQWSNEDWEDELGKAEMELNKLQAQIDNLSKDTSLAGQLKLEQLKEQYQEQLDAMNQMIKEHEREQANQMLEDEKNRLEEEMKQALSAENLANLVNEALSTGMVKIGEEAITLNDLMLENIMKQENAYYALGEVMKSEMLASLKEAKTLYMDIDKINSSLVSGSTSVSTNAFSEILSKLQLTGSRSILENNSSPLVSIVMQGDLDEKITLNDVERVAKTQCDKLLVELNKIMG